MILKRERQMGSIAEGREKRVCILIEGGQAVHHEALSGLHGMNGCDHR